MHFRNPRFGKLICASSMAMLFFTGAVVAQQSGQKTPQSLQLTPTIRQGQVDYQVEALKVSRAVQLMSLE